MTEEYRGPHPRLTTLRQSLWLLVVICVSVLPDRVVGQTIDTNRPGFSFSPNVVGTGQWQLETGISCTRSNDDSHTTSLPLADIRTGVSGQAEVFLSSLSWSESTSDINNASGLVDTTVGTKIKISSEEAKTQMALLFQLSVPTGDSNFSSDRWDPSAAFIWVHSGALAVAGTVKVSELRSGFQLDNGLKLPFSWGDTHSGLVEWEANPPEGGGNTHWSTTGLQEVKVALERRSHLLVRSA